MGRILSYKHGERSTENVDPRLWDIVRNAIAAIPYDAEIRSGGERAKGDRGNHSGGYAVDVTLIDPKTGEIIPDTGKKGGAASARVYEQYAQAARVYQQQKYPELDNTFRWGGGFRQGYPFDLMHLDITPERRGAMAYYNWEKGFTHAALKAMPELEGQVTSGLGGAEGRRRVAQIRQTLQGSGGLLPPADIPVPMKMPAGIGQARLAYDAGPDALSPQDDLVQLLERRTESMPPLPRRRPAMPPPKLPGDMSTRSSADANVASLYQGIIPIAQPQATMPKVPLPWPRADFTRMPGSPFVDGGDRLAGQISPSLHTDGNVYNPVTIPTMGRTYDASNRMSVGGLVALLGRQPRYAQPTTIKAVPGSMTGAGAGVETGGVAPYIQPQLPNGNRLQPGTPVVTDPPQTFTPEQVAGIGIDMAGNRTPYIQLPRRRPTLPPVPASAEERVTVRNRAVLAIPSIPLPRPRPITAPTAAEIQWQKTNFRDPYDMPGVGMPKFSDIAKLMGRRGPMPPLPVTMPAGLLQRLPAQLPPIPAPFLQALAARPRLPTGPLQIVVGNPQLRRQMVAPVTRSNGVVYTPASPAWSPFGSANNQTKPASELRPGDRRYNADTNQWERK